MPAVIEFFWNIKLHAKLAKINEGQSRFIGQFLKVVKQFDSDPNCFSRAFENEIALLTVIGDAIGIADRG